MSVEHFPALITVSSWVVAIADAGIMAVLVAAAYTYKPNRTSQAEGVLFCILMAGIVGSNALARALDAYVGGAVYYATQMPDKTWPLLAFEGARFVHVTFGMVIWVWVAYKLRVYKREAMEARGV